MTPLDLNGKTALVTGGNRGIGLAVVRALADAGAQVTFTARSQTNADTAMAGLAGVTPYVCDVTDRAGMMRLLEQPFDILINNAGVIGPIGRITDAAIEDWAHNINVNLISAFHAIQLAMRGMLRQGGGTIVNLSAGAARRPIEGWSAYCSGKAGLAMVTRSVHEEFGPQGIRIFGFAPGLVDTDMQGTIRASGLNAISRLPRDSLTSAADPARAIAWLCTPAADPLLGQEVDVRDPDFRRTCGLPVLA